MPQGAADHPGQVAAFLHCVKLNGPVHSFPLQFILSTIQPDEARTKDENRNFPAVVKEDHWVAKNSTDRGFWDQSTPKKCKELMDAKGNWGLLVQMIPGNRRYDIQQDY